MHTAIETPYADTRAGELTWQLGLPHLDALATLELELIGGTLELRLLGASHQAVLQVGDVHLSEVVACLGEVSAALPQEAERDLGNGSYSFTSDVLTLDEGTFAERVEELVQGLEGNPRALVGTFPGSPHAVTALVAETDQQGVTWRTWHAYPQSGELVVTRTVVRLR